VYKHCNHIRLLGCYNIPTLTSLLLCSTITCIHASNSTQNFCEITQGQYIQRRIDHELRNSIPIFLQLRVRVVVCCDMSTSLSDVCNYKLLLQRKFTANSNCTSDCYYCTWPQASYQLNISTEVHLLRHNSQEHELVTLNTDCVSARSELSYANSSAHRISLQHNRYVTLLRIVGCPGNIWC